MKPYLHSFPCLRVASLTREAPHGQPPTRIRSESRPLRLPVPRASGGADAPRRRGADSNRVGVTRQQRHDAAPTGCQWNLRPERALVDSDQVITVTARVPALMTAAYY